MGDMPLRCTRCGAEATYADAQIADWHDSCRVNVRKNNHLQEVPSTHDWSEQ